MTLKQSIVTNQTISLLLPLPLKMLKSVRQRFNQTCESLLTQGIDQWELLIGVTEVHKPMVKIWVRDLVLQMGVSPKHFRLVKCDVDEASGSLMLNKLVKSALGDWVGFVFVGDQFAQHYVYECLMHALRKPAVEMIYFDDDFFVSRQSLKSKNLIQKKFISLTNKRELIKQGEVTRERPQFKPDFSPDFLYSQNYIGLSFVIRRKRLIDFTTIEFKQSLNFPMQLVLGLSKAIMADCKKVTPAWHKTHPIQHSGHVLRHRDCNNAMHEKHEISKRAKVDAKRLVIKHLQHAGHNHPIDYDLTCVAKDIGVLKLRWQIREPLPKVSIIVPTKDHYAILKVCLSSLLNKTMYSNYEVLVVDNQTTQSSALRYLAGIAGEEPKVTVLKYDKPFNYSDINNQAVTQAQGEVLLFLNNDVEILHGDWLTEMVSHAMRPDVGCVGAKLLYPDSTIQHAGVALGMHGVADHMFRGTSETSKTDPYRHLKSVRNPGAVTGAVLAMRASVFKQIRGFDAKHLPIAFNDVDLCLKAEKLGYRTVWTPHACLVHHESKTRASRKHNHKNQTRVKFSSHDSEQSEIAHMRSSWRGLLKNKFHVLGLRYEPLRFL